MQSGIKASPSLQAAFQTLLSTPSHRGLLAHISTNPESLTPGPFIPSQSPTLSGDLPQLESLLSDTEAAYVILRQGTGGSNKAAGDYIAVTYVPDRAPVRTKMLFASTRLSLVRELGTEHFSSTIFATTKAELSPAGWAKHEAHVALSAPLTAEEQNLVGIREAEAQESMGTSTRRGGHVSKSVSLPIHPEAKTALKGLVNGEYGLVQLEIDTKTETLLLASSSPSSLGPTALSSTLSSTAPRYSFYSLSSGDERKIIFIYTCPSTSTIKQKMMYAASRNSVLQVTTKEVGVEVAGKVEAGSAEDVTEEEVRSAAGESAAAVAGGSSAVGDAGVGGTGEGRGFSRPKRPGRR